MNARSVLAVHLEVVVGLVARLDDCGPQELHAVGLSVHHVSSVSHDGQPVDAALDGVSACGVNGESSAHGERLRLRVVAHVAAHSADDREVVAVPVINLFSVDIKRIGDVAVEIAGVGVCILHVDFLRVVGNGSFEAGASLKHRL